MAKILLVEDDNNLREIYQARLAAEGYDIATAQDGEEALVVAKKEHPDLIISDVMMPRISGFEMLDILRNTDELKSTKIIMLTALGQAEDQARADNLGADKYLVKSQVTLEDIVKCAQDLLNGENLASVETPAPTTSAPSPAVEPVEATASPQATAPPVAPLAVTPEPIEAPKVETAAQPVATAEPSEPPLQVNQPITQQATVPAEPPVSPVSALPQEPEAKEATPGDAADVAALQNVAAELTQTAPKDVPTEPVSVPETPNAEVPEASTPTPPASDASPLTGSAETSVDNSTPQTLAAEEKAIQDQITSFAGDGNAAVVAPTEVTPGASETQKQDDGVMAKAVEELNASVSPTTSSQAPATEPVIPASAPTVAISPETPHSDDLDSSSDQVPIAHKRVIQPIDSAENKTSLDELLAREDAKDIVGNTSIPTVGGQPPAARGSQQPFDPNNIAL